MAGGVAMAIETNGIKVKADHVFTLHSDAANDWKDGILGNEPSE